MGVNVVSAGGDANEHIGEVESGPDAAPVSREISTSVPSPDRPDITSTPIIYPLRVTLIAKGQNTHLELETKQFLGFIIK